MDANRALRAIDLSDPTMTTRGLLTMPAGAGKVFVGNGIAFVADGTAGLQVVNYRAFDNQGVPPTIALNASFQLTSPTNGLTEEAKRARVTAIVTDDVQVRDVEFYVDGAKVFTDVSFPF